MLTDWRALFNGSLIASPEYLDFCNAHKTLVLASLPVVASEIAGLSGFNVMFELINRYGGKKIYLPVASCDFIHTYAIAIQEVEYSHWRRMAKVNGQVELPSAWGIFLAMRRAAIYTAIADGMKFDDIVFNFGVTQRQLRNIKSRMK